MISELGSAIRLPLAPEDSRKAPIEAASAGVQPMYDLASSKHAKLKLKPMNFMIEIGMGCDCYLPFFKLIPELKFCFGLGNVLDKKRKDLTDSKQKVYTNGISSATANMFVLSFYFE